MMEAARTFETSVKFSQTTRRYNPGDSYLRTHRRENLKSYRNSVVYKTSVKYYMGNKMDVRMDQTRGDDKCRVIILVG
jgi:hypothetical protein